MTPTSPKEGANPRAVIGGNAPPDPLDEALAPYGDFITEAEGWLDGTQVTTAAQMKAVDDLAKEIKAAEKAVSTARDAATKPLHAAWQAEIKRWKPTLEDLDRIKKGLAALVSAFKVIRDADLPDVTPHTLKHTAVTWAMHKGVPLADAAGFFGTTVATLESVYLHHHPSFQEATAKALDGWK
ncbi:hypothetical protein [Rhodovulum sp. MB263]|uniref:hypothetical protein n=1 Tax=Rhodovulum sp. (strain MB263) TaxID=308754 RepID=UPI0012DB254C|nr:hypothetical protein [Rhodovulum sp. MB263]